MPLSTVRRQRVRLPVLQNTEYTLKAIPFGEPIRLDVVVEGLSDAVEPVTLYFTAAEGDGDDPLFQNEAAEVTRLAGGDTFVFDISRARYGVFLEGRTYVTNIWLKEPGFAAVKIGFGSLTLARSIEPVLGVDPDPADPITFDNTDAFTFDSTTAFTFDQTGA